MKRFFVLLLLVLFLQVQTVAATLPAGTLVIIQPDNNIDADDVKQGDLLSFNVVQPVKYNNNIIIKAGTEVKGVVSKRKNNGIFGIPGELEITNFQIITKDNEIIRLRGTVIDKGDSKYWANVGWIFLITIPMVFIKGNDANISVGSNYMIYTAEDIDL